MKRFFSRQGIVSLTTILIIGTIIMETALVGLAVAYLVGEQGFGVRMSYNATYAAKSGAQDAVLRIIRNKDASFSSGYTMGVGGYQVAVTVSSTQLDTSEYRKFTVLSTGSAMGKRAIIEAVVILNAYTGGVSSVAYREL